MHNPTSCIADDSMSIRTLTTQIQSNLFQEL